MATISIRITDEERDYLMQIAKDYDVTLSWVGRKAIKDFIKRRNEDANYLFASSNEAITETGICSSTDSTQP